MFTPFFVCIAVFHAMPSSAAMRQYYCRVSVVCLLLVLLANVLVSAAVCQYAVFRRPVRRLWRCECCECCAPSQLSSVCCALCLAFSQGVL